MSVMSSLMFGANRQIITVFVITSFMMPNIDPWILGSVFSINITK